MEKIRINAIDKKDSGLVIVNYNDKKEATLNTKWQAQEVDYLINDVGIGGEVSVMIVQKGDYTNITKVDMTSAVKGGVVLKEVQSGERSLDGQEQKPVTRREDSIIAQYLVKAVIGAMTSANVPITIEQAVEMYKKALELL